MTVEEAIAKIRELVAADHATAIKAVEAVLACTAETKQHAIRYGAGSTYWNGMANHAERVEEALEVACGLMDDEVAR